MSTSEHRTRHTASDSLQLEHHAEFDDDIEARVNTFFTKLAEDADPRVLQGLSDSMNGQPSYDNAVWLHEGHEHRDARNAITYAFQAAAEGTEPDERRQLADLVSQWATAPLKELVEPTIDHAFKNPSPVHPESYAEHRAAAGAVLHSDIQTAGNTVAAYLNEDNVFSFGYYNDTHYPRHLQDQAELYERHYGYDEAYEPSALDEREILHHALRQRAEGIYSTINASLHDAGVIPPQEDFKLHHLADPEVVNVFMTEFKERLHDGEWELIRDRTIIGTIAPEHLQGGAFYTDFPIYEAQSQWDAHLQHGIEQLADQVSTQFRDALQESDNPLVQAFLENFRDYRRTPPEEHSSAFKDALTPESWSEHGPQFISEFMATYAQSTQDYYPDAHSSTRWRAAEAITQVMNSQMSDLTNSRESRAEIIAEIRQSGHTVVAGDALSDIIAAAGSRAAGSTIYAFETAEAIAHQDDEHLASIIDKGFQNIADFRADAVDAFPNDNVNWNPNQLDAQTSWSRGQELRQHFHDSVEHLLPDDAPAGQPVDWMHFIKHPKVAEQFQQLFEQLPPGDAFRLASALSNPRQPRENH